MTRHLPYDRAERVADEVYRIAAGTLLTDIADPRLSGVRITRVKMTKDLRIARIFFHMMSPAEGVRRAAEKGLVSSRGFLKRRIGEGVKLKFMPEIEFFYDEAIDTERRIESLLKSVHE